ncbi:Tyrosine-protein phosphatase 2 [Astathelohania contejeani]|uniref:Tyrosine-protein phosphatase 2 n=1 Tax=Astathelohania contejeani TaxID=164912 RepID=A0ABQ7HXI8_9MICR|nr:Tyrosine-protein phosphatase 2 [Thelohania contejeani]
MTSEDITESDHLQEISKNQEINRRLLALFPYALHYMKTNRHYKIIEDVNSMLIDLMRVPSRYDTYIITPYTNIVQRKFCLDNYVNASIATFENKNYLICQKPPYKYRNNFIELIKKSDTKLIISLLSLRHKDYFSDYKCIERENIYDRFGDRVCIIELYNIENTHIRRIRATTWEENCSPINAHMTLLYDKFKEFENMSNNIIVHSGAGVDRACTFVMYNILMKKRRVNHLQFLNIFYYLRSKRPYAIKNVNQFTYLVDKFVVPKIVSRTKNYKNGFK